MRDISIEEELPIRIQQINDLYQALAAQDRRITRLHKAVAILAIAVLFGIALFWRH